MNDIKNKIMLMVNSGEFIKAKNLCQKACKKAPSNVELWFILGAIYGQLGDFKQAELCCHKVTTLQPGAANGYYNLAVAQRNLKKYDSSEKSYRTVLEIDPNSVAAWFDLGNVYALKGDNAKAISCYDKVLTLSPNAFQAYSSKASVEEKKGKYQEAIDLLLHSLKINNSQPDIVLRLCSLYESCSNYPQAEKWYINLLENDPENIAAITSLSLLYNSTMQFAKALSTIKKLSNIGFESKESLYNYALILASNRRYTESIEYYSKVIEIDPEFTEALVNMGNILLLSACPDKAHAIYLKAHNIKPDYADAASNMLLSLNYTNTKSIDEIIQMHVKYAEIVESSVTKRKPRNYHHDLLRIGYVSPDFRKHSVAYFFDAILRYSNKTSVVNYCYSLTKNTDSMTQYLKSNCDHWRDACLLSDEQLATQIENDEIDILVDLSGHTAANRLRVFAMKPAPIQMTYLGYPNTTGLTTIDYRIVDKITDPIENACFMTEKPLYMKSSFLCYSPISDSPPVSQLPAIDNGYVTFGSFNNLAKMTEEVIEIWSSILTRVKNSKLCIKARQYSDESIKNRHLKLFETHGIGSERLILMPYSDTVDAHLSCYSLIDIALDTFPYNGTTTSCESLWMGVPVVSILGNKHASRVNGSILNVIGMHELLANSNDEYIEIACSLAGNLNYLATMRQSMRSRMENSPLLDGKAFTKELEDNFIRLCS